MHASTCLESTYKELKRLYGLANAVTRHGLESTYKELKLCIYMIFLNSIFRLESTYKELKPLKYIGYEQETIV